ncbi:MAG TPA: AMP-binding protein, partial [Myxococcaceae bacterium]|nr:AMP-binding protein [Myxococcaceae bacterium]
MKAIAPTIPQLFLTRVALTPDRVAYWSPLDPGWNAHPWRQVAERVRAIAGGLRALGLAPEQRCALLSGTRLEWMVADLGVLCAGGATTTIYPSNTAEETAFIISDSGSAFVFAENATQLRKLTERRAELPHVKKVILFEGGAGDDGWSMSLDALEALGRETDARDPQVFEATARAVRPDALATLIYTSGTTGRPKGVELTHDCWVYEAEGVDGLGILREEDVQYFWLPLAHSFGKMFQTVQMRIGFPTALDGRMEKLLENLSSVRPTFVAAVPRVFEKVRNGVMGAATKSGGVRSAIFERAMDVGHRVAALRRENRRVPPLL